tara:strand:- start:5406 stop:6485 length:1080 start_codon:yes stop_codon:yes gene_type:complete
MFPILYLLKKILEMVQGTITTEFHDALVLAISDVSEEEGVGIYDIIKILIFEMNREIDAGEVSFGPSPVFNWLQLLRDKNYSHPFMLQSHQKEARGKKKGLFNKCLLEMTRYMVKSDWNDVSWYEFITYLLFIQSNTHHKVAPPSKEYWAAAPAWLCRNSEVFLDFFYKSKDSFHPLKDWTHPFEKPLDHLGCIHASDEPKKRAWYWVERFEKEKKDLLMFRNWGGHSLGQRETTGWFGRSSKERDGDVFPCVSVINELRALEMLPRISGEYDLGVQQANRVAYAKEKELEAEIQKLKQENLDLKYDSFEREIPWMVLLPIIPIVATVLFLGVSTGTKSPTETKSIEIDYSDCQPVFRR